MIVHLFICCIHFPFLVRMSPEVSDSLPMTNALFDNDHFMMQDFSVEQHSSFALGSALHANQTPPSTIEYWASIERQWSLQSNCPCRCELDVLHRKVVYCDLNSTHVQNIPNDLDSNVQVFIFTGTLQQPKSTTLPRVFEHLRRLEHVQITYADVPSIGDATFWPGDQLLALDLSHNRIARLQPNSFLNLSRLHTLDLSYNRLKALPSGAFVFLPNLDRLTLAHNLLGQLAPSTFLKVNNLRQLDLSHNPLSRIQSNELRGLRSLTYLNLAHCLLVNISIEWWLQVDRLQLLDLTANQLIRLHTDSFRRLGHLRTLKLSHNLLTQVATHTFSGARLQLLDLSHNRINQLDVCVFCNVTIHRLDLGHNQLVRLGADRLQPLSSHLHFLRLSHNRLLGSHQVQLVLRPLSAVKYVDVSGCSLDDRFQNDQAFKLSASQLIHLNMSDNALVNLSASFFAPFVRLQVLDLSANRLFRMPEQVAHLFARRSLGVNASLNTLRLHSNPFRCFTCHVRPLRDLFRLRPPAYFSACDTQPDLCARCSAPLDVAGQLLHSLPETRIRFCSDPGVFQRLYASEPRLGLILALVIICSLLVLIVLIVCRYRRQRAVYYTHESKLNAATLFTIQQVADATAFSPSLTSPSDSSPTHSAAANDRFHRLPFSRQISSETASQRDMAMNVRASLDRSTITRPPPDPYYDTTTTLIRDQLNEPSTTGLTTADSDSRRPPHLFNRTMVEHFNQSIYLNNENNTLQQQQHDLNKPSTCSAGASSSGASSVHSNRLELQPSGSLAQSNIDFRPPISEHLLRANVRTVHTQPIYSQPSLASAPYLITSSAAPPSVATASSYAQSGLLLDPNVFATHSADYFTPTTTNTALLVLNSRNSSQSDDATPKMYQI